jgi:hypothetical protein
MDISISSITATIDLDLRKINPKKSKGKWSHQLKIKLEVISQQVTPI